MTDLLLLVLVVAIFIGVITYFSTTNKDQAVKPESKEDTPQEEEVQYFYPNVKGIKFLEEGNKYKIELHKSTSPKSVWITARGLDNSILMRSISEPTITLLNIAYDNPKRFSVKRESSWVEDNVFTYITVLDKYTKKEVVKLKQKVHPYGDKDFYPIGDSIWLTYYEVQLILFIIDRVSAIRTNKHKQILRRKLAKEYCNEKDG